jgi:hypothetical protein
MDKRFPTDDSRCTPTVCSRVAAAAAAAAVAAAAGEWGLVVEARDYRAGVLGVGGGIEDGVDVDFDPLAGSLGGE